MSKDKEPLTLIHVPSDACVCEVPSPDLGIVHPQASGVARSPMSCEGGEVIMVDHFPSSSSDNSEGKAGLP